MPDREKMIRKFEQFVAITEPGMPQCVTISAETVRDVLALLKEQEARWIPIISRPMDEEERKEWSERLGYDIEYEDAHIYTSPLPDDGDEVITCDRYGIVRVDTFYEDEGCYFEYNGDMDGIVAWMPMPKPYKPPKEDSDAEVY